MTSRLRFETRSRDFDPSNAMISYNFPLRGPLNDLGWMTSPYTTTIPYFHASRDGINSRLISCLLYQTYNDEIRIGIVALA